MNRTRPNPLALAVAALLVLPSGAARAQFPQMNADRGMLGMMGAELAPMAAAAADIIAFGIVSSIGLADITAAEILDGSAPAVDMGGAAGAGWSPSLSSVDVGGSAPVTSVQRSFNVIWAAWVRKKAIRNLVVQYDLQGPNGAAGALVHGTVPSSRIAVASSATRPRVIARAGKFRLLVGGGIFTCDLAAAEVSGRYQGQLIVTLTIL